MEPTLSNCIDCGTVFVKKSYTQVRCPKCQERHRKEVWLEKYLRQKEQRYTEKNTKDAVYINGHPQVCKYMKSCYYGSTKEDGCSYAIEERKTRTCNGHYIVDGKCDLYRPKSRKPKRTNLSFVTKFDLPAEKTGHNYSEV